LSDVATALSANAPSATLLINGGDISWRDAAHSLQANRPLIVLDGSGRAADAIAEAARCKGDDSMARAIAGSPLTRVVPLLQPEAVVLAVADALGIHLSD